MTEPAPSTKHESKSWAGKVFDFLSSFGLATVLLIILGLLTWFATLEQIDRGLYATLEKYFDWRTPFLLPEIGGRLVPLPLPGGYWVGVVLVINLTLGGVIRIRKGWKHIGNLIAHLGIIFMLIAGGVAHHFSQRGNMAVGEGETNDAAEDYFEYVVEVAEIKDGKASDIHVIGGREISDLTGGKQRIFRLPNLPFDLEIAGYEKNALPVSVVERAPSGSPLVVDGYYLMPRPEEVNAESNTAACYARVINRDGSKQQPFILAGASFHPFTIKQDNRTFTVDMRKRLWSMPFALRLEEFKAEFHPGTSRPAKFVSHVTRIENGDESKVTIQMNEPMRYEGLTFFQASYGPPGGGPGQKLYSVFEVVKNPADMWPEYSLYIVTFGMMVTFLLKLFTYLGTTSRKKNHV